MNKISSQQYIIGIGASAGGLEAIAAFFDYTPLDAVSYIVVQHLSADFKSQMAQILSRHTKLHVVEVINNTAIIANTVYLIPSSSFMTIERGMLILSEKKDMPKPHLTVDHFFISLAKERGDKAIGIILSGTGHDGSRGIKAIQEAGGLVIVQDPKTAHYNEMPLSAIDTGCVDIILSAEAMPQVIEDFVKDNLLTLLVDHRPDELSEVEMAGIINLIKGSMPLDFSDYKRATILRRIKRRMILHNISHVDKYYAFLKNNPQEIMLLANDFLISVTSFFRDPEAFKIIENTVIPSIVANKKNGNLLKIWVAGCATGEEAYSLAILIREQLNRTQKHLEVKIFATDLNMSALDVATRGIYSNKIEKLVSTDRLNKFFTREDDGSYKIKHEIRKMLIFAQHNLVKNPPYCSIDLISCRNLLIYLNAALQNQAVGMMHFGLKKEGYLFLGPSENAVILKDDFVEVSNKWNIFRSNKSSQAVRSIPFLSPVIDGIKTTTMEISRKSPVARFELATSDEISFAVIRESGFHGVCINERFTVLRHFGEPTKYLKNELFNLNLIELLPESISVTFKAAAHQAIKTNKAVSLQGINLTHDPAVVQLVDIDIKPLRVKSGEMLLLIFFKDDARKSKRKHIIKDADINRLALVHLLDVEKELAETKHSLSVAYDRIAAANEHMQSFNEELQSANEEMQSANEELQSVNEELQTINNEQQLTNAELTASNDDLNNYFRSNVTGQLFVDQNLLLKKYSPATVSYINIRDSDIGRPLSNISTNIALETLIEDINEVIAHGVTITREAAGKDHQVFQVMTIPYLKKNSQKPDGAIVSFYDITELKELLNGLDISNQSLLRINADLNNFVYGASHDLNAPIHNIEMVLSILDKKIDPLDTDVVKLSAMMNTSIANFKSIISDLGEIGIMEAELSEERQIENVETIFDNIAGTMTERIRLTGAVFITDFKEKKICFSRKYLRSILLNLITNAIRFSAPGISPEIRISTEKANGFILLSVQDNGIGIEKDRLDFIFNVYQRINPNIEGQGVGLYLVKKIVDAAGGKITVDSEVRKGSTFKIYFKS
ncbi:MAG: CheR family methyltransferase [Sphingobacteriaceae bacterium]